MESLNEMSWSSESVEVTTSSNTSRALGTMLHVCMAKAFQCDQQMVGACGSGPTYDSFTSDCDYF